MGSDVRLIIAKMYDIIKQTLLLNVARRLDAMPSNFLVTLIARFMGPTHLGPTGPRRAPCWPHEPCYLGCIENETNLKSRFFVMNHTDNCTS